MVYEVTGELFCFRAHSCNLQYHLLTARIQTHTPIIFLGYLLSLLGIHFIFEPEHSKLQEAVKGP